MSSRASGDISAIFCSNSFFCDGGRCWTCFKSWCLSSFCCSGVRGMCFSGDGDL